MTCKPGMMYFVIRPFSFLFHLGNFERLALFRPSPYHPKFLEGKLQKNFRMFQ